MKELYMMKNLNVFYPVSVEEANEKYGEVEFPEHDQFDDDLCPAVECESCGTIFEYDPNYYLCPFCEGDKRVSIPHR